MKQFCIFTAAFLAVGVCSLAAQDLIILKNGNLIEAKVMEISLTEIRYKRFEHLDGPTIVIPAVDVLSIRYENGDYEVINAAPAAGQGSGQRERPGTTVRQNSNQTTAIDPNWFIFGINANAGGALGYLLPFMGTGAGINIELGKGNFNSEIHLMLPSGGFGFLATFNYFWHSRIGGFYLGGGLGFSFFERYIYYYETYETVFSFIVGLNIGYKFVTPSGLYFRTGAFGGYGFGSGFFVKPDLAIGWTVR